MKTLKIFIIPLLLSILTLAGCSELKAPIDESMKNDKNTTLHSDIKQKPFDFKKKKELKFKDLDDIGRPQDAHIRLKFKDKPKNERAPYLKYNPPGWHNYRIKYTNNGKTSKYWTFNRSHMIGYLFSGVNDEPKNLFTGTSHLNKGTYNGMDQSNQKSMLYYETSLNDWLKENPDSYIDYQVTPLYKDNELVPRKVRLAYTGFDKNGKQVPIQFGTKQEQKGNKATVVILENKEPDLDINYKDGTAKPTH